MNCKDCKTFYCPEHGFENEKQCKNYTPPTNADRIRDMTDEEMVEFFSGYCPPDINEEGDCEPDLVRCYECWRDWLQNEAEI